MAVSDARPPQVRADEPFYGASLPDMTPEGEGEQQEEVFVFPCSFAQQRLWFLDQLEPGSPLYNIYGASRIRGEIRIDVLTRAIEGIAARHESLRTTFALLDGEPVQVVAPFLPVRVPLIDLQGIPAFEQEVARLAQDEARKPFDLRSGPLLRVTLLRLGPEDHVILPTMHHIISDGWSIEIFIPELTALYEAFLAGRDSPLPPLPIQYADFALWQRERLQGPELERQLAFWRGFLDTVPALEMPTDRPRPMAPTYRGGIELLRIPATTLQAVRVLSMRQGSTSFMTLLACFGALLFRYTGQELIHIGTPVAGRNHLQTEKLIGFFVNTLVLRADLRRAPSFLALLARVREMVIDAQAHQDLPFEKLVEELQPERVLGQTPFFQVMFSLKNNARSQQGPSNPATLVTGASGGTAKFDLSLTVIEGPEWLATGLEYSLDLFDPPTALRFLSHYAALLDAVLADPDRPVAELSFLSEWARMQLLVEWNDTAPASPPRLCVHSLFSAQAHRVPDAVALVARDRRLTYQDLDRRANHLAHRLRTLGVGPEVRVGLFAERSLEAVVGVLAILKAGGAYVPLDPEYPEERLRLMVADSRPAVLLAQEHLVPRLPDNAGHVELLRLEEAGTERGPESGSDPDSLAYVMYTSGSTGKPKGVGVPHRAIVRLVRGAGYADLGEDQVFLLLAPMSFDASTLEIWGPLLNGGRLVLYPAGPLSLDELGEELRRQGVTTLWLTAGLFHLAVDQSLAALSGLRQLLAGGDVLSVPQARRVLRELPGLRLINGYGPTENTTFTCCHPMARADQVRAPVPIGRPISATEVYIVDRGFLLVPIGVAGELVTGGAGLARGYLDRPDLTAERFVPHPFAQRLGARLYRTGDLARRLPNGLIEFLGRADTQVKVRGFRVEPGEIETLLSHHPAVRASVVVLQGDGAANKRLVAYVVLDGADASDLRAHLAEQLPEYMIPAVFVELPELPLTAHGKIDRRSLPAPDLAARQGSDYVAPRTPVEEIVAGLWADVLHLPRVSVLDNFFELGGHSLLATQLISRLREAFGVELPLRALFEHPAPALLAQAIEDALRSDRGAFVVPISRVPRDGVLPLSFAQQRLWFLDQLEPESSAYNIATVAHLEGRLETAALAGSFAEVVRRHESLRTRFSFQSGQPTQVIADAGTWYLPLIDFSALAPPLREQEALRWAGEEAVQPFDLERGPLLRARLFRLGAEDHFISLAMHHIVSDGWSMQVLMREVSTLYRAFGQGRPSPLPELPVQYADYAAWQRSCLDDEVLQTEIDHWRRRLSGAPVLIDLPMDRSRPSVRSSSGAVRPFNLPDSVAASLRELARKRSSTLFMSLLAAFEILLSRYSGQTDLCVGSPVSGRNRIELEGLIGFFVNTLVLRADLADDPSFASHLARVRATLLEAHAHQDLPFERLVEELEPRRSLSHTPLFQVVFALQEATREETSPSTLRMRVMGRPVEVAKFDLTLSLAHDGQSLSGGLEYGTELFDATTIERLLGHFTTLLESAVADPSTPVSELCLLPGWERHQVLVGWNDTESRYPRQTVHELFAEQAERAPGRVAVVAGEREVTYGELEGMSNAIASRLIGRGVGWESRVGICLERSPEMVASLLGVLRAGGAFVPLDAESPRERLAFLVKDAGIEVVVTERHLSAKLPEEVPVLFLEEEPLEPLGTLVDLGDVSGPDHLAYVMHTSGSTGRPKGVGVPHRAIVRLVRNAGYADFGENQVFLQLAPVSFDASTLEIWGPLLNGGRLVLYPPRPLSLEELSEELHRHGVTTLWLTAGLFHLVVDQCLDSLAGLRQLLAGGDVLSLPHVERALYGLPGVRVINGYGPTENTTFTCCHPLSLADTAGATVPIGRPIPATRVSLLDRWMRPVPIGVAGELCIGGDGLARGYLGRPELTAERFAPEPNGKRPGERVYRTGDLARWLPDGRIEFLGRNDAQVKVRGFRIEPAEVEVALAMHPAIREVVVVALPDGGDKRLVAYCVTAGAETGVGELRSFLRERLPEHMVPSVFVTLESLPLTPNGKVDRRALPEPEVGTRGAGESYTAPRTPVEELVAQVWAEVLRLERVGVEANFFELGGHSLLATQVVSRLRHTFSVEVPLRRLFETPTVAGLAQEVERLQREERGLVLPPLVPVQRDGRLPLSFAQQRLWFIDQLEPGSPAYNIPVATRLEGELDTAVLARSLSEVVRRHEALRTVFRSVEGGPIQDISLPEACELPEVDLSGLAEPLREAEARALASAEAQRPFDLAHGPLLRCGLLRLGSTEHVVLVTMHHIVSDGWSMDVLLREITTLYAAFAAGEPSPLPELPIQYADYAAWQRSWLQGEVLEAELASWRRRLSGAPPLLGLPTDRPRPAVQAFRGANLSLALSEETSRAVGQTGRRLGATPFMVLLAAFQTVLGRHSGSEDVVVGSPIAGRNWLETEGLIGFFVNTLVLRTDLSGHPSFAGLLGRVREAVLEAYAHQDVPFERLVEELAPERSLAHAPLFQVMLVLQNVPREAGAPGTTGPRAFSMGGEATTAKFDLTLGVVEREGRFGGALNYNVDLFDRTTVARLAGHFETLLASLLANAEHPVLEVALLTEGERHQLSAEWNDTAAAYPRRRCLHRLFEAQVERVPDAVAVSCAGQELTYADLERRSNRLAHSLRVLGVGRNVRVGIFLKRSLEMVEALLGVLKAGGAYVPLDPEYPHERLAAMLEDAAIPVVLTQERLRSRLPPTAAVLLSLDDPRDEGARGSAQRLESEPDPEDLAYVLFTSGSTGRPKGVMISHAAIVNHMLWMQSVYPMDAEDCILQKTPISFDASVWELWAPLLAGARLALALRGEHRDPRSLIERLLTEKVTVLQVVPSLLQVLLQQERFAECFGLRRVFCGGEILRPELREHFHAVLSIELINLYGPTEATINSSSRVFRQSERGFEIPIGRPIGNGCVVVVSPDLQTVPVGVGGELLLGGDGLARGYLGRPELTAERFVPDPFGTEPGGRLYRTGDLVRWLRGGELDFLGRIDHQVKVRGFRIELGEVESALRAHPSVQGAVVVAREGAGGQWLVAYLTAVEGTVLEPGTLRDALHTRLPDYMVPAAFVVLESLPLTPNGKVDRKALPEPEMVAVGAGEPYVAPRTPVEELVAQIWADVLHRERVGIEDNFFELGGHSLLATQVISRLRSAFSLEVPLRRLFEAPTVAGLAQEVERLQREARGLSLPPLVPVPRDGRLPLSFAQQRLWFIDQLEPGSPAYNIPVARLLEGPLDAAVLARSLSEVVRRHEALRTVFRSVEGGPIQDILPPEACELPVVDLSGLAEPLRGAEARALVRAEALRPFDLVRGPLLRCGLLRLGAAEHAVLATMHHIVSDGWSMEVLLREVTALYAAFAAGAPSPLPELPIQYADYAAWQRSWLQGEVLEAELSHWRERLAGAPPLLELPLDRPRPAMQTFRGTNLPLVLEEETVRLLLSLGRRHGVTPFMALLAAFQIVLARHSGSEDVVVGSPIAGRNRLEIEGLIGFFVNTLVLRMELSGETSFAGLLGRARETVLEAHAHQDLPFERLVEDLAPVRSLSYTPLFQVMLVLQNVPQEPGSESEGGPRQRPEPGEPAMAKVDLTLALVERGGTIEGALNYNVDLFDSSTAERFLGHFANLLASAVEDPGRPIFELRLMDAAEERLLQSDLNQDERIWALPVTVHDLLTRQARRTPDKAAAVGAQGAMTYRELTERSSTLAFRIQQAIQKVGSGARLDQRIGLLLDSDPQVLVGMIGILEAGCGFVPIDPRHPDERLAWTLKDCACEVLVTQRRHLERAEGLAAHATGVRHILCLDDEPRDTSSGILSGAAGEHRDPRELLSLAYVVYTSGSTGRPKGVQVSHESLVPMLLWGCEYLELGEHIRVLQSLSICFDFGIFEHLTTLLAGGTLWFPGEAAGDPVGFAREIFRHRINTLHTTPAFARELAAIGVGEALESLEVLHLGGEALSRDTVARLREAAPHANVYNGYGPTEATVNSSIFQLRDRVGGAEDAVWPVVPIGRRSADNALYILDRAGRLVPFGVRGELHVGGIGVARGYLNRPDLTAERFVPDSFGAQSGGRLYRTGDLVRWLGSGELDFLGRIDDQVKVRGFRIELGEVETALRTHPAVREAVVLAREDGSGGKRLVAYVVAAGEIVEAGALRQHLRERLPEYMVPSVFVTLESLPLTSNGKVDRQALPEPEVEARGAGESYTAPRTPVEELVAQIWAEVLHLERVGAEANFFELGGHSLLATQVVSRLRSAFSVEVPLRRLFETPTVAGLAQEVERLQREGRGLAMPPLVPVSREGRLPLSFAQQRLWFIDQLEPDSPVYNIPMARLLEGPLDEGSLARSLAEVARRHEAARTVFRSAGGEPEQVIQPPPAPSLPVVDLSGLPEDLHQAVAQELVSEEALCSFDLTKDLPLRSRLLRLGPAEHVVLVTMHHIASDGWSVGVLLRELRALYGAFSAGLPSPLPELKVQYPDFAVWQRSWLQGDVLEAELSYWRERLAGAPPLLELPTDRPRRAVRRFRGAGLRIALTPGLTQELNGLARREGATLFMVLLGAFQTLLARHSGQLDLTIGTPIAGRNQVEVESLIGFFVNTLVLRGDLSDRPSFAELLGRAREEVLSAHLHQEVPFERIVEELHLQRSLSYSPLFQVMLVLQNTPREAPSMDGGGLRLSGVGSDLATAKFDLTLSLVEREERIDGVLTYDTDLFDAPTVSRLLSHFQTLIDRLLAAPGLSALEAILLQDAEIHQLLVEWNDTGTAARSPLCLHHLVEAQVVRTPDAVAVSCDGAMLTYGELDRKAGLLALHLRRLGVGPEVVVGVYLERSPELIEALLAILKAGGAWLPLDPELPSRRIALMLEDARVSLVVSCERLRGELPGEAENVVCLDHGEIAVEGTEEPWSWQADPQSLSYVLFTSGSTGRPKGVMVSQAAIVNHMLWMQSAYPMIPGDRALQKTPIGFDASVGELFAPLVVGARLAIALPGEHRDPAALHARLRTERVTVLHLVPSLLQALLEQPGFGKDLALRRIQCGGEPLSPTTRQRAQALVAADVVDMYGPTEATIHTSSKIYLLHEEISAASIGHPIENARVSIVDRRLSLVPFGVPGELLVGGSLLARGYIGRPALTAERFVPDACGAEPGERLYRTGDLARWLPGGEIELLGRIDDQVKVRGFRIELGEVEAALGSHPGVREVAVMARDDGSGSKRLIAYVAPKSAPAAADLRTFLQAALPDYMIPSLFVALDALPRTPNGKVDRQALPAGPDTAFHDARAASEGPRTPVEELMAQIWAEVLHLEWAGAEDDFFELGGHSLLATQVVSRLRSVFEVEVPLRRLFEAPTVAGLAQEVERLQREARGLLLPPLVPVPRDQQLPLSFAQQRLWFIDQLEPGSAAYNIPVATRLNGELDAVALARSLCEVVRRHEALRTVFREVDGEPVQMVLPPLLTLPLVDLGGLPELLREAEAQALVQAEARRPFDLACGPLLRCGLLRLEPAEHVVLVAMHHIVSDGWSMEILLREITALYAAFAADAPSPLPELPIQYADYAAWQRSWLQGEVLEAELAHWRRRLSGAPPLLELPTDRPRPAVQTFRGANLPLSLPEETSQAVTQVGRRFGATPFMVLLAAFQAVLGRHSGSEDVVVGSPIAGRNRLEIEGLIGFFVNTLVLRTELSGRPGFAELLGRVREAVLEAHAHQDVPFERLVEELAPERSLAHSPLFQVMLVLQNIPREAGALGAAGPRTSSMSGETATAKFDLTLGLVEREGRFGGTLNYNVDLFDRPTVARLAVHFETLLAGLLARVDESIVEMELLTESERHQVLLGWSDTESEYPRRMVYDLFAEQAGRVPDRVAVVAGEREVTYGELERMSSAIAARLVVEGVGVESRVGVCLERSPEMVASLLGVLRVGGAFVPLDAESPSARLSFLVEDAGIEVVLTERRLAAKLPEEVSVLCLEEEPLEPCGTLTDLGDVSSPDQLAYVMYTSGSTGRPKGVGVPHRAVVRLVRETAYAELGEDQVFLQLAPVSFDASTLEIWGPLLNGGRLVLYPPRPLSLEELSQELQRHEVTTLWLTAGLFHLVVDQSLESLAGLRQLLAGGDVLSKPHVERALRGLPGVRVINGYGPTESTTFTCCYQLSGAEPVGSPVPIGRPISATWVSLLDRWRRPVPIGVAGELCIGGDGLARGYLDRPELTAERFAPDPNGRRGGDRVYRTGDLARWLPDGRIEFLGRNDTQVKVRGFRIEPAEVEAALAAHPAVRETVVVALPDGADKRLVAYYVAMEIEPGAGELRSFLRERLPEHMVPSVFVALAALPLTPNGKVDRKALPEPEMSVGGVAEVYVAPRTPVEELVAQIWREVLQLERVGAGDNFFELGGHSLLATQVISRLRHAFSLEVPLRRLFEAPTVAGLAQEVERLQREARGLSLPPLVPVSRDQQLPLSFAQQRLWFLDQLEPGSAAYNIPVATRLNGKLDAIALAQSLGEVVRRHEALRTVFLEVDGEPVQVIQPPLLTLPLVDLCGLPELLREAEAQALIQAEARRPFDLARGPLLRCGLLRLGPAEHVVLVTMHHIVSDGWSMEVLQREITALYAAFAADAPSPLPELPIQYADYAAWQRSWLQGEVLEGELAHWRRRLSGAPPLLELPTDRPRPAVQTFRGANLPLSLSEETSQAVTQVGRQFGATPFMVLLAAFQAVLGRHSGSEDVVVGSPIAGRNRLEIEGLIGFFVNTLVLRTELSGRPGFAELLGRVREAVLEAYAHQDVPFERLVEELAPERSLAHSPLFQVMLVLQNVPREAGALGAAGPRTSSMTGEAVTAKFDLTLALVEREGRFGGTLNYNVDLFDRPTVARLAVHFETLLAGLLDRVDESVVEMALLTESERHQLLVDWPATRPGEIGNTLHGLFARQARRTPERVALVCGDREMSYGELAARSDALARQLAGHGVGPDVPVGICLQRTPELVVALLGVLKAGGCYVPLDPAYPEERRLYMLADSGAQLLVTQEMLRPAFASYGGAILCVDGMEAAPLGASGREELQELPGSLAYVIYTSGSTGRPKGVAIEHRSASALLVWAREVFSAEELDGVLASTSVCFDLSIFELFVPLAWGGRVLLVQNALELAHMPASPEVRLINTVPSAIGELLELNAVPETVLTINLAGEPLTRALVERLYAETSTERVLNLYGPSEDTTYSTFCRVAAGRSAAPSIGHAIDGTQASVVDRWGHAVPVGVAGELLLGGVGLARGYLGRPDLTAERFVPNPLGTEPGSRLYRTGDLVRWQPEGELGFLGRIDHQVKVRGFRIELGEVEAALRMHPMVQEVVVLAREGGSGDRRLVAYVVAAKGVVLEQGVLRQHLRERLPEHMIPSAWVLLEALPLTLNGKVNRKALPEPERAATGTREAGVLPRDRRELLLAQIWQELLGVPSIGVRDDFFELGGHSLQAVRLMARVEKVFGIRVPLAALFRASTIEGLAALLREAPMERTSLVRLQPRGSQPPLFWVHPGGGGVLCYAPLARQLGDDRPFYAFQAPGFDGEQEPLADIESMASWYLAEMKKLGIPGPYHLGGWSIGGLIAYEMAQQLQRQGERISFLGLVDTAVSTSSRARESSRALGKDPAVLLYTFARDLGVPVERLTLARDHIASLDTNAALALLYQQAFEAGLVPSDFDLDRLRVLFNVFRNNVRAAAEYVPKPYLGRVTLFTAEEGAEERRLDRSWQKLVPGLAVEVVPGDHFTMVREPHVETLARRLRLFISPLESEKLP